MSNVRPCREDELASILSIINCAAQAYRGAIPADCWHEPYMSAAQLCRDICGGVIFWGYEIADELIGVMGIQPKQDVDLIRHAYVLPRRQRHGVGTALITHLHDQSTRQKLVGTWTAADWAIDFYRRHGFEQVTSGLKTTLLETYWDITDRQMESSVVLANPPLKGTWANRSC